MRLRLNEFRKIVRDELISLVLEWPAYNIREEEENSEDADDSEDEDEDEDEDADDSEEEDEDEDSISDILSDEEDNQDDDEDDDEDDEDDEDDYEEEEPKSDPAIEGDEAKELVDDQWKKGRTFLVQAAQGSKGTIEVEVLIASGKIRPGVRIIKFDVQGPSRRVRRKFRKRLANPELYAKMGFNKNIGSAEDPYVALLKATL